MGVASEGAGVIVVRMRLFTSERKRLIGWYRWWLGCLGCLCVCARVCVRARRGGGPGEGGVSRAVGVVVWFTPFPLNRRLLLSCNLRLTNSFSEIDGEVK